ncbi:MAG TPA: hypothetical protein VLV16_15285 [Gemmatimonadales bacterium]|nr:hypothetical protein [Gemmatimonadales bacterium]
MSPDAGSHMRIVIYYAAWTIVCAAVAGVLIVLIHTLAFSDISTRSGLLATLFGDVMTVLAVAAGQGAVALATGSVLAQYGRPLARTVLLGLLIGAFDFVMTFLQMAVPRLELGWGADIVILAAATALITVYGAERRRVA